MPRLMSVAYTEQAVVERRKTVTRRAGWSYLRPGDRITLCRKVMGRKADEPLVRICDVEVVSVRRERLSLMTEHRAYGIAECDREGFPDLNPETFIQRYFTDAQKISPDAEVTRVEWRYL